MSTDTSRKPIRLGPTTTGTWTLLKFLLHRDRVRLPAWIAGITVLMAYFCIGIGSIAGDEDGLASIGEIASNPMTALVSGPGYGFDDITVPRLLVGMYGAYILIAAAFMGMTTMIRHTRAEEQSGRAELVRANIVGRSAHLTATVILIALMSAAVATLIPLVLITLGGDPAPSIAGAALFGASVGAIGMVFAGIGALTSQVSSYARGATGLAGGILGVAFALRGLGDMSRTQGGSLGWLSWLSPFGWAQQSAPLTLNRWWPLLICALFAATLIAASYALHTRRDLNAGLIPDRLGPARAAPTLGSAMALAIHLQRPALLGWSAALAVAGICLGGFTQAMVDTIDQLPEALAATMGAQQTAQGYVGFLGGWFSVLVAVYAVLSVRSLRDEESSGRLEPVIATGVGRPGWIGAWTSSCAGSTLWLLLLTGVSTGLGAALSTGDLGLIGPAILGAAIHAAPVWLILAIAALLYGIAPRAGGLAWVVLFYGAFLTMFGPMLALDDSVLQTSPYGMVGQYPAEPISWGALGALTAAVAILLAALGTVGFRRRDLGSR